MSKKSKIECSKVILIIVGATIGIVILYSMIMIAITQNLDPINWILGGLFSLADVAVGFYYWKSRKENEIKLRAIYGKDLTKGIVGTDTDDENDEELAG